MEKEKSPLVEKAISLFNTNLNCAQSVLTVYADILQIDTKFAMSVTAGFGSGMGRLQATCGAVTGAFMALSIYNSNKYSDNGDAKEHTYEMIQDFNRMFLEKHHATDCKALLQVDLLTEEGEMQYHIDKLSENVCEVCIADAINLINKLIEK